MCMQSLSCSLFPSPQESLGMRLDTITLHVSSNWLSISEPTVIEGQAIQGYCTLMYSVGTQAKKIIIVIRFSCKDRHTLHY